jgi:hypothetical protein
VAELALVAALLAVGVLRQPLWAALLVAALPLAVVALTPALSRRERAGVRGP